MTESDLAAPVAAAHSPLASECDPGGRDPTSAGPRRGKRWPWLALAGVGAAGGLTAGLVAWAPWMPPPVLRPAGLAAGRATATSISFRWSRPPTGPLPDKYLILRDGKVIASAAGTATSYQRVDLTPATGYQYRLVAVRDGTRSPLSAAVAVRTRTRPIAQARLQGGWIINLTYPRRVPRRRHSELFWQAIPACPAGPCDVTVLVNIGPHRATAHLARAGASYQGHVVFNIVRCGHGAQSFPDPATLTFRVRVVAAAGKHQQWAATELAGTMTVSTRYVSNGIVYCRANTEKAALAGSTG
jgi:hypothetical protein